jgi:hypothetical protein
MPIILQCGMSIPFVDEVARRPRHRGQEDLTTIIGEELNPQLDLRQGMATQREKAARTRSHATQAHAWDRPSTFRILYVCPSCRISHM